jgi:Rps23 Pro-64 3,4-dihydroxylase Tpa1-like proline 4-hydroxylase
MLSTPLAESIATFIAHSIVLDMFTHLHRDMHDNYYLSENYARKGKKEGGGVLCYKSKISNSILYYDSFHTIYPIVFQLFGISSRHR